MNFKKSNLLFKSFSNPIKLGISLAIVALNAEASRVRGDVDYQYFRDFGENKGLFSIGATNIHIFDKNGQDVGIMLKDNIPMPDLKTANKNGAFANLIDPSFITSVRHNVGYSQVLFGGEDTNPDSHHFSYLLVNRNNFPDEWDGVTYSNPQDKDYHIPRLHKMVTEVAPAELTDVLTPNGKENTKILTDLTRFPLYIRVGSGKQEVQESAEDNSKTISLSSAYKYVIGGVTHTMSEANATNVVANGTITPEGKRITDRPITLFGSIYGPMVSYGRSGDSGSALLGYDAQKKKWVIVGVLKSDYGYGNIWSLSRPSYVNAVQERAKAGTIQNTQQNQVWEWSVDALHPETSSIKAGESTALAVPLRNESLKSQDTDKERPSLDYGKSVIFDGVDGGVLLVKDNINAGAGALYFNTNFTVKPETNQTWLGGGVLVAKDKTVTWKIANPEGDRLSKLGTGTLLVQGVGNNLGDISIGDGTVILDQQEDEQGRKQAFNQVGVVSGRPTLVLQSADQIDPNKLYFGFRGGRLDLNGNDLSFKRIQHSDDGATVVNHRTDKSSNLTLTGVTVSEQDLTWGNWGKAGSDIYEYAISGRKDYFALKSGGKAGSYYPTNQASSDSWEYLGSDRASAIETILERKNQQLLFTAFSGYLGEKSADKPNGVLNVNYQPARDDSVLLLSGGMNLNGDLSIKGGKVILEGIPTPHARDVLNNREVIFEDDWINRDFSAKNISVANNSTLTVGRNVSSLDANISATDNAILNLGYQSGQKVCLRSDYTGSVSCDSPSYNEKTLATIPRMALTGDITLTQQSQLNLGKTDFVGSIQGEHSSRTSLSPESHWTLTGDSKVGNLNLDQNSQITLSQNDKQLNTLTVDGDLSGNGKFYYRTQFSSLGSDKVIVNGEASGDHLLIVDDIGTEPQRSKARLTLMTTNSSADNFAATLQNNYADIGTYRYSLIQDGGTFRLYNPIVEKEIEEEERKAAEEAKRQEEERKKAEAANLTQSELISRISNTALSELSAQVNVALKNDQRLNQHYLQERGSQAQVWTNLDVQKANYQSDNYRAYEQRSTYTELGAESAMNEQGIRLGGVVSQTRSNIEYENARGKTVYSQATVYATVQNTQGLFVALDLGYGRSNNTITLDDKTANFKRNIVSVGSVIGKKWALGYVDFKTIAGLHYHHLSSVNYELKGAEIRTRSLNLVNYQMGAELSKTWLWNEFFITPSIAVHYFDANRKVFNNAVLVNNNGLQQQFNRSIQYQAGLNMNLGLWYVRTALTYERGRESSSAKELSLNVGYIF
ncbi:autotransporter outer membrane beta-barrel domain-containing protein [Avibacterium paragallinarum]|uniref:S6 family peptidase n=1 Tax=Avibacterium paragallinarum TaxID=728 RepID=UPI0021F78660|nr:S6 family peptidase [Avibacterium paragallinarum]UXN35654.1 autotransporter outer membrane beta-barrel domain-containing protein [Avibacterium paragallinarum]